MRTAQPGLCRFALSADVGALLRCRADRILPQALEEELVGDEPLDIEVDLVLDGKVFCTGQSSKAVFDTPERGKFKPQQFIFAIKVRDLPLESQLHFRWRDASTMLRSGVLPLFNDRGVLRQGQRLVALMSQESLSACGATESCMDSNQAAVAWVQATGAPGAGHAARELEEALRLAELLSLKDRGWIPSTLESEETFSGTVQTALESSGLPWLSLQLPELPHSVVFAESSYGQDLELPVGVLSAPRSQDIDQKDLDALKGVSWLLKPIPSVATSLGSGAPIQGRSFKCFVDEGASLEHPAVLKRKRLGRGQSRAVVKDRDARPSADELRRLAELVRRPRRHLSPEEKDLLFRFRWSLTDQPGALTKFLHAVNWVDMEERSQAIELLGHWSPVEIEDALELLSKDFQGLREVRRHAVQRLESASDMDLQLYLLQLVQALRYEHDSEAEAGSEALAGFLIRRAVRCTSLATLLYWYVAAEIDEGESGGLFDMVRRKLLEALTEQDQHLLQQQVLLRKKLLWCLRHAKAAGGVAVTMAAIAKRDWTDKKIERFRHALVDQKQSGEDTGGNLDLVNGLKEGIPLPVDPSLLLVGILPEECTLLKSAMNPGVLACQVRHANKSGTISIKKVMVKEGDDLRQDQLVLQLIILMDSILKRYGLDLQLTPYQVIALSRNDGMVDFVPDSANLSKVLKEHSNDIQQFFRSHHPAVGAEKDEPWGPQNSYGIKAEVLENFVRSSAGYCVITYILGIGDRHLDNLMVTKDGRLFHIDFGFILGKDPKPFPPPMRICKEMVEGMGGNSSPGYLSFKSKCCQAFKILRRHSKLIINLLYLMTDSGIKDICSDPQFAILKVEQKFQALMDDEEAEEHFLNLIDESVSALMPMIMEIGHKISVDDLRKAVLQIAATGGGWPVQLQKRLLQLLQTPCEARSCLFAAAPLSPEVDEGFTSPRALSGGWLHQAFLTMGSITGIPSFRARAELYRSQPPSVILSNASITQMRDCFAFRGSKEHPPALALRLRSPSVVTQLIIEQPPRWAALRPDSLPRRFRVYGATEATSQAYTENLGDFVYAAAGPAVQAFHLANASGARLTGLRMVFEGPESDKHYICLYRLKLLEGPETACSNGRAAWRLQTNSD